MINSLFVVHGQINFCDVSPSAVEGSIGNYKLDKALHLDFEFILSEAERLDVTAQT